MILPLSQVDPASLNAWDWVNDFKPFTLFHLVTFVVFGGVIVAWCWLGLRLATRSRAQERAFRRALGAGIITYQLFFLGQFFFESPIRWERALPLMLCDLAALLAGAMLVWHQRWMRAVLYFWAIGLSSWAFFTPILQDGLGSLRYWFFWLGHTFIVGAALYDVVVHRFRPSRRDLLVTLGVSFAYLGVVIATNATIDRLGILPEGVRANYGYVGNSTPANPTPMDVLGAWPGRVVLLVVICVGVFVGLWKVWSLPWWRRPSPRA